MSAWYLKKKLGDLCRVTIFEASDRLGGKIVTRKFDSAPAMYEAGGRQFLIVCSMDVVIGQSGKSPLQPGYIAYALPREKLTKNTSDHTGPERTPP